MPPRAKKTEVIRPFYDPKDTTLSGDYRYVAKVGWYRVITTDITRLDKTSISGFIKRLESFSEGKIDSKIELKGPYSKITLVGFRPATEEELALINTILNKEEKEKKARAEKARLAKERAAVRQKAALAKAQEKEIADFKAKYPHLVKEDA